MVHPDKFSVLIKLLIEKDIIVEGEYSTYYMKCMKELNIRLKEESRLSHEV